MSIKKTTRSFVARLFCKSLFCSEFKEEIEENKEVIPETSENKNEDEEGKQTDKKSNELLKDQFVEECHLEWVSTIEDIRIAKKQQWSVVYYGFLLQSGLLSSILIIRNELQTEISKIFFIGSSIFVCLIVAAILLIFQSKMKEYRGLIKKLEDDSFTKSFNDLVKPFYDRRKNYLDFLYGSEILILMILSSLFIMSSIIWFIMKI
jgi:hypothetical protein